MHNQLTEGHGGRESLRVDKELHQAETKFLQETIRTLQIDLQEQLTNLGVSEDQDSLPEGEFESLATRQRLDKVLRQLLHTPERDRDTLETILKERLRQIHKQLSSLEDTVEDRKAYDEAFWEFEHERQVFEEILGDWGRWSRDANIQQGRATD